MDGPGHGHGGLLAEAVENISCWGRGRPSARVAGALASPCGWPVEWLWVSAAQNGGVLLTLPSAIREPGPEEWWAHLSRVQSCLLGPGAGAPPGQQRGQRRHPRQACRLGPMGSKDEAAAQVCGGHPGLALRPCRLKPCPWAATGTDGLAPTVLVRALEVGPDRAPCSRGLTFRPGAGAVFFGLNAQSSGRCFKVNGVSSTGPPCPGEPLHPMELAAQVPLAPSLGVPAR